MNNLKLFIIIFSAIFMSLSFIQASQKSDTHLRTKNNYQSSLLELGTGYTAKLYCSCRFQMQLSDAYCKKFVSVNPDIFTLSVDEEMKVTVAKALIFFHSASSQFVSDQKGCRLN